MAVALISLPGQGGLPQCHSASLATARGGVRVRVSKIFAGFCLVFCSYLQLFEGHTREKCSLEEKKSREPTFLHSEIEHVFSNYLAQVPLGGEIFFTK